jgi:hypothetical protein
VFRIRKFFYFGSGTVIICLSPSKNKKKKIMKILNLYGFVTSLKTDENVPTVRNKQKKS